MLNLLKGDKHVAKFPPDALMVFVDETGHEQFADPHYPVFGLGGCAAFVDNYADLIRAPWEAMKEEHFDGEALHASEMHGASDDQLEAIGRFFREHPFYRLAATLDADVELPNGVEPYRLTAPTLLERLANVDYPRLPSSVALILEESQRTRGIAQRYFSGYHMETGSGDQDGEITVDGYFMPKSSEEAGLEVADFVMHAAGTQRREGVVAEDDPVRKDFEVVFRAVDDGLVSVFNITRASEDQWSAGPATKRPQTSSLTPSSPTAPIRPRPRAPSHALHACPARGRE